jgi:WD40 repeat protein
VVVVGGTDGSVHARALIRNGSSESPSDGAVPSTQLDETLEPITLKPPHGGPVIALTPIGAVAAGRESGLLASGAHDGTLRIWDLAKAFKGESQACLFGLGGYKVRGSSLKVPLSASSIASLVACLTECLLDCFTNRMPH